MSDHLSLIFKCSVSANDRGKGYWKLNTSVLQDPNYCSLINDFFTQLPKDIENENNAHTKWELIKHHIKKISIKFCTQKNKSLKSRIQNIEKDIERIENSHYTQINMIKKKDLEDELDKLYEYKSKGAQIRSRAKWIDEGEKNTSYFLRLENKHQSHNVINTIRKDDQIYNKTDDILKQLYLFYENFIKILR